MFRPANCLACLCVVLLFTSSLFGQAAELPPKAKAEVLDGPPLVSAAAWAIADGKTGKLLWGGNETTRRVMASTTKMMTAWIVLQLAAENPKALDEVIVVSERAAKTGGSSAKIQAGERYPVRDMLYGLLLPSGNDAAVALGEHFGKRFVDKNDEDADPLAAFVAEMNRRAAALKMTETKYFDPHGNSKNHSCARDLTLLAHAALKNPLFAKYVQTRRHQCE
ncbi:MAG: D-alanyl-D-alanine carboxypeptidase family protein, partial [Gemmataceae bacterium]